MILCQIKLLPSLTQSTIKTKNHVIFCENLRTYASVTGNYVLWGLFYSPPFTFLFILRLNFGGYFIAFSNLNKLDSSQRKIQLSSVFFLSPFYF
jgi:hypothetical protein